MSAPNPTFRLQRLHRAAALKRMAGLLVLGVATASGGCGSPDAEGPARSADHVEIVVSAAASLSDAFREIALAFETANPGTSVALNFAGTSSLRAQIMEGAPVDVFASADLATMQELVDAGEVDGDPSPFATNRLAIVVPVGNSGGIVGLQDFARGELVLGLCAEPVPCGRLARAALARAGVTPSIDSSEPDVRALLAKVGFGELDGGIAYVTDATSAGEVVLPIEIAPELNVTATYPIAVLRSAPHPESARAFVTFVLSTDARAILARHGFGVP